MGGPATIETAACLLSVKPFSIGSLPNDEQQEVPTITKHRPAEQGHQPGNLLAFSPASKAEPSSTEKRFPEALSPSSRPATRLMAR
jgi:hypothetical protein